MAIAAKSDSRSLTPRQQEGRAVNAVAEVLRKRLTVPNIYLEPRGDSISVDVLAVDRAGSGDLHAVQIKLQDDFRRIPSSKPATVREVKQRNADWQAHFRKRVREIHRQIMALPAHFRYLAILENSLDMVTGELGPVLYSADGIGRIGIIAITDRGEEAPVAEVVITPERFRVDAVKLRNIEKKLLEKVRPDIEVRI